MKKVVVLIIIGVAGLVGYNYYTTGEISLKLPSSLSKEVRELKRLEKVFHKAQNKFFQGSRSASVAGLDSPADLVEAMGEIENLAEGRAISGSSGTPKQYLPSGEIETWREYRERYLKAIGK